jgi:hypothetical protein
VQRSLEDALAENCGGDGFNLMTQLDWDVMNEND